MTQSAVRRSSRSCFGPSAAEAARSVLANASSVRLGDTVAATELARHAMLEDGTVVFVPPAGAGAAGALAPDLVRPVRVVAVDLVPIAVADRVRGTLTMTADLSAHVDPLPDGARSHLIVPGERDLGQPVMRLVPRRMAVQLHLAGMPTGPVAVDAADYRAARPDPLLEHEADWLAHLDEDHADVLEALADAVMPTRLPGPVRAVRLSQYGVSLRVGLPARDVNLSFAARARCGCDLVDAFAEMLERLLPGGPTLGCDA